MCRIMCAYTSVHIVYTYFILWLIDCIPCSCRRWKPGKSNALSRFLWPKGGWMNSKSAWNTLQHCGTTARHLQLPCKPLPRWFQPLPSCMKCPVFVSCWFVSSTAAKAESSCSDWSSQPESGMPFLNATASFVTLRCTFSSSTAARSAIAPSQSIESWGSLANPTFGGRHKATYERTTNSTAPWNQNSRCRKNGYGTTYPWQ